MTIQELLEERRIYKGAIAKAAIVAAFERAQRDLSTARKVLDIDTDWAFSIAYNAVFQGYRPASNEGHKNTFAFMLIMVDEAHEPLITYFDRMRVKRHQVTYDAAGAVTQTEARNLLSKAEQYVEWIHQRMPKRIHHEGHEGVLSHQS